MENKLNNNILNKLKPFIINYDIYNFISIIDNLEQLNIIITYDYYAQYILNYVIKHDSMNILEYLIQKNTFEFYNNNEYLNYEFSELQNLNSKNFLSYNFYTNTFTDILHPLFYIIDSKKFDLFMHILNYNININIINEEGITLLDYIYFKKDIPNNIKICLIQKLFQKGATWNFVIIWKNICKYKYINDIKIVDKEFKKYNIQTNKPPISLLKDIDILKMKLNNIYLDLYLLKNSNLI
jgi:hypothetical protein